MRQHTTMSKLYTRVLASYKYTANQIPARTSNDFIVLSHTLFSTDHSRRHIHNVTDHICRESATPIASSLLLWSIFSSASLVYQHTSRWHVQRKRIVFHQPHLLHVSGCPFLSDLRLSVSPSRSQCWNPDSWFWLSLRNCRKHLSVTECRTVRIQNI